ncbi:MAG TPA: DUF6265 family protein, partial [Longimicrobiales bacterium]|nr:DUF6265 family protein [Longimicrobiales bacterium]
MRLLGMAVLLALTSVDAQAQAGPADRAGWLAGCWEQRAGTRVTVEMWMAPFGGTMLGASRTVSNGVMAEHEFLRLSARGDTLVYTAMPSGQAMTEFRATTVADTLVRFE